MLFGCATEGIEQAWQDGVDREDKQDEIRYELILYISHLNPHSSP